jgi:beta-1,2-mannobiose phosphorylase / 1,2-beta-oligomannan phosphorylase
MFTVTRSESNPILVPDPAHAFDSYAAFNGNPIKVGSGINLLYRGQSQPERFEGGQFSLSVVCQAASADGIHFKKRAPFIVPEEPWERFGCEDPRVTKFGSIYYIFYTALSAYPLNLAGGVKIGVALSKDMKTVSEKHLVTSFNAKAMTLFPEKINGKYLALLTIDSETPPSKIAWAEFDRIEDMWSDSYWKKWKANTDKHLFMIQSASDRIEIGSCPVKTKDGWLLVYCHVQNHESPDRVFGVEAVLLDLKDPRKIIGRTRGAILVPETDYERYGLLPNIIFPSGALIVGKNLRIYYGATDTTVATAEVDLQDLLESMKMPFKDTGFTRLISGALLAPRPGVEWEAKAIFNPAAIEVDGVIRIVYRAMSRDNTSVFGYAESKNGIDIDYISPDPIYVPRESFEEKRVPNGNSGCEDPRLTRIGDTIYMYYVAYNGVTPPAVAETHIAIADFAARKWHWSSPKLVTADGVDDKDACLHPEKIGEKYFLFHRVNRNICGDYGSSPQFPERNAFRNIPILLPRPGMWDGLKVGISVPPIKTPKGWLLLYHGVSVHSRYRVGAALLDPSDPTKVLSRTAEPLLEPKEAYELSGQVSFVVFPCGAVVRGDTIHMYYGGGDSVISVASLSMKKLLKSLGA